MKCRILLRDDARSDLIEAAVWYDRKRAGWGDTFVAALEAQIDRIAASPEAFPLVRGSVRRSLVRQFPFVIFYVHRQNDIVILAIVHASRDPQTWMKRIDEDE